MDLDSCQARRSAAEVRLRPGWRSAAEVRSSLVCLLVDPAERALEEAQSPARVSAAARLKVRLGCSGLVSGRGVVEEFAAEYRRFAPAMLQQGARPHILCTPLRPI